MITPTLIALGYVRTDLSGDARHWDARRLRKVADRYGYRMPLIVAHTSSTPNRCDDLLALVRRLNVDTVVTPYLGHLPEGGLLRLMDDAVGVATLYPDAMRPFRLQPGSRGRYEWA